VPRHLRDGFWLTAQAGGPNLVPVPGGEIILQRLIGRNRNKYPQLLPRCASAVTLASQVLGLSAKELPCPSKHGVSRALAKRTTGAERLCTTSEVLRMRAWVQDREVRCDGEAA